MFSWRDLIKVHDYKLGKPVRYIQAKADGLRLLIAKDVYGVSAITRNGKTDFWPQLKGIDCFWPEQIAAMPNGTAIDGELHVPGDFATNVITYIKAGSDKLVFSPFAMPFYQGEDCRERSLRFVNDLIRTKIGIEPIPFRSVERLIFGNDAKVDSQVTLQQEDVDELKQQARQAGCEGWVIKHGHYDGWWKIKPLQTVDCVVMDYKVSDSDSFEGGLKAVVVGVYKDGELVQIASVGTGFEAEYRMTVDMDSLVGRVCEVSYDSLAGQGKLKFPRFVRWREDKTCEECLGGNFHDPK